MSVSTFIHDEQGQSMVEYGITLGGVAAVSYIAVVIMGERIADLYTWMANHLPGGEEDDNGQVRVSADGLVGVNESVSFNGDLEFANRTQENYTMEATLGGNNVAEGANGEWEED